MEESKGVEVFKGHRDEKSIKNMKEALRQEMQNAQTFIHEKSNAIDKQYITPVRDMYTRSAAGYPLVTLFATLVVALSALPVLGFLGFCIAAGSAIVCAALVFAVFWLTVVLGTAALITLAIVGSVIALSAGITLAVAGGAILFDLIKNVRISGSPREAVKMTAINVKAHMAPTSAASQQSSGPDTPLSSAGSEFVALHQDAKSKSES